MFFITDQFLLTVLAKDRDIFDSNLSYRLATVSPVEGIHLRINSSSGVISVQDMYGVGHCRAVVIATDSGDPVLSGSTTVVVNIGQYCSTSDFQRHSNELFMLLYFCLIICKQLI